MDEPRLFTLIRKADETGVSGTGRVLDGAVFHTGQVIVCWRGDVNRSERALEAGGKGYSSIAIYPSWEAFKHVHIDPHPSNRAEVVFAPAAGLDKCVHNSQLLDENLSREE